VYPKKVPGTPTGVTATASAPCSAGGGITVQVNVPANQGPPILGYQYRHRKLVGIPPTYAISGPLPVTSPTFSGGSFTFKPQLPAGLYGFSVRAINSVGPSAWSAFSNNVNPGSQAPDAITLSVTVRNAPGGTGVIYDLTWNTPANVKISEYRIYKAAGAPLATVKTGNSYAYATGAEGAKSLLWVEAFTGSCTTKSNVVDASNLW
jgi:hypothetical protein